MLPSLSRLTPESIESNIQDHKVILFSPRSRTQNAMLGAFIKVRDAYLYTLTPQDSSLDSFLRNLIESLAQDNPRFGGQTIQALGARKLKVADLADALVADLGSLKPRARALILDSFDFLPITEDVIAFLEKLILALPDNSKLVINSRRLSYEPWQSLVHSGEAVVLGEEQALDGGILTASADAKHPHLEVYAFGRGSVYINGREIEEWDGPLPRNLFFYFMDHPMVTRDEIFETFWPGMGHREATNVFHVTKRKITERVGVEMTGYSTGFYKPSKDMIFHYDVAHFEAEIADATRQENKSIEGWYKAVQLYRNAYLMASNMPWINERREQLRLAYANALISVGRIYKSLRETEKAVHFYLRALNEVPDREDIHRDLMTVYEDRGERDKALNQYKILKTRLRQAYGIAPSEATRKLYALLTGEEAQ
ncbi:MAG TPA: BTAD domain-containing putative transcriptional regulator [Aggregatilineales bacterium]|nr:BTAD domain-containing putative transcriptional regulator [Aggregatilineales bacterium]